MGRPSTITVLWMDRVERELLVEDRIEHGWSVADPDGERFYIAHDDGTVSDDAGMGDWLGVVADWNGLKKGSTE
jgi:hypothetical protein